MQDGRNRNFIINEEQKTRMRVQSLPRRGSVTVEGATLRYVAEGDGIPVLVIGSSIYYPGTFSGRFKQTYRTIFTDLRHFAEIDPEHVPSGHPLEIYTDDLERIRQSLGLERFVLVGHSHHGSLAFEYAKRYPERASHVVIIGSPPVGVAQTIEAGEEYWKSHASEERKSALKRNRAALESGGSAALSPEESFISAYVADAPKLWYDINYDASFLWRGVPVNMNAIRFFRQSFLEYELWRGADRLKAPVLIVMGRFDYVVPHYLWRAVLPKIENAAFHLFERSGHTPQMEEQNLFDRIFARFINK